MPRRNKKKRNKAKEKKEDNNNPAPLSIINISNNFNIIDDRI